MDPPRLLMAEKKNQATKTRPQMHAGAHLSPPWHSSSPPYLQRGVFLCVIGGSVLTETDGGTERGPARSRQWRSLPPLFWLPVK